MTVLVAIDFSETSMTVLAKAVSFMERNGTDVHIVHVVEETWLSLDKDIQSISDESWHILHTAFPELKKKFFHCLEGNVTREISELAETIQTTMLIIGSSGEHYMFKELLIGSTTKNIVRDSAIPVLVIKNDTMLNPQRILIPTNFSDHSKTTIQQTAKLFPDAELILLKTYTLPFEGRLKTYGFTEDDIVDLQMQIKDKEDETADALVRSLNLPFDKVQMITRKDHLNPPLFLEIAKSYQADMISLHTSGTFSFFAFDLLEESLYDVLICRF
jgi:nucleotide-binding universal stress UspA family protein